MIFLLSCVGVVTKHEAEAVVAHTQLLQCCFAQNVYATVQSLARVICEEPLAPTIVDGSLWLWTVDMPHKQGVRIGVTLPFYRLQALARLLLACGLLREVHCPFSRSTQFKSTRKFELLCALSESEWRPAVLASLSLALKATGPVARPIVHTCLALTNSLRAVRDVKCASWWSGLSSRARRLAARSR